MIVRQNDPNTNDWTFGLGKNNYLKGNAAVAQNIKTRLQSFLGDCFFAVNEGVDWFNFLGSKDQSGLTLAISNVILKTQNVVGILQLSVNLTQNRAFSISYRVQTTFSVTGDTFIYALAV